MEIVNGGVMNVDNIEDWLALKAEKDIADMRSKSLSERMADLEKLIVDDMSQAGVQSVKVAGYTVYIRRDIFVKKLVGDNTLINNALKSSGYADMVKEAYAPQSLAALLREFDRSGDPLPAPLAGVIEPAEVFRLGRRSA